MDRAEAALVEVRDGWLRDVASSVLTAVLLTTALEPSLRRPGGRIVTISSIAAIRGGGESLGREGRADQVDLSGRERSRAGG